MKLGLDRTHLDLKKTTFISLLAGIVFVLFLPNTVCAAEKSLKDILAQAAQANPKSPIPTFFKSIDRFVSDEVQEQDLSGNMIPMYGRDNEADQTIDTLVRLKGKNPVLVGEAGVGKSSVAELVAQKIYFKGLPTAPAYTNLKKALVVEVSAASISSQAESTSKNAQQNVMRDFLQGLKEAEKLTGRPIIIFVDEIHALQPAALQVLKTSMESTSGIHLIGATTHSEFKSLVQNDEAMRSRLQPIPVREFSPEESVEVLKRSWVPTLEKKYNVKIEDSALRAAVRTAPEYDPFGHRPRAPFKVLQDAAIFAHRKSSGAMATVNDRTVGDQVAKALGYTLNPADREKFRTEIEKLRKDMREEVVDQGRVTDKMVDLWRDLNMGTGKNHRVMLIAGPTGAGKTFSAQTFAKKALGTDERMLEINAAQFNYGEHSLNTLVGSPPGTVSAEQSSGILPEFLAGKGKGQNVIVINEIEKANPEFMTMIMEMLDTGKLQARDGKTYSLGKSLVVFTSNKGDDQIYPRGKMVPMTREEIEKRLDKIGDREVRQFFMKPNPSDLYDKSKVQPASVLNRIDATVAAAPPSAEGARKIALQKADSISKNFYEQFRFRVKLDPDVADHLVKTFYVPEDGVRDLNRATEKLMNDALQEFEKSHPVSENETLNISLIKAEDSDDARIKISSSTRSNSVEMAAPISQKIENPLVDPRVRTKLSGLESKLENHVFGQPDAIKTAAKSIRLRATNLSTKTPAVSLDLGPTGIGKTELGKAIATEVFSDPERYVAFDMGKVKSEAQLQDIFGSSRGFVGSHEVSPFEQFLQRYPDGGVITFDEIGNMGGHNGASKESLLKYFYSMLDEGRWTSPLGETYDLRKYVIRFTSNEGQDLFKDLPSDDLRMAAWKEGSKKENLVELLKKEGWPEALIARLQGNITLYRPVTEESRKLIAKKMTAQTIRELKDQYGFKSFDVDENFHKALGESFFSHSNGARSMKPVTTTEITDLFSEAIFDDLSPRDLKNATFHASLSDNYSGKYSFKENVAPERKVMMNLTVDIPGKPTRNYIRDLSDLAAEKKLVNSAESYRIALHEAGHAVVNDPLKTGEKVAFVTVRGQGGYGGYARYESIPGAKINTNREAAVAKIGRILAGGMVEEKYIPGGRTSGWASDKEKAAQYAETAVTKYGLTEKPLELPVEDGKVLVNHPKTQREIRSLLEDGEKYANQVIEEKIKTIRATALQLYKNGHMDQAEFEEIIKSGKPVFSGSSAGHSDHCIRDTLKNIVGVMRP